MTTNTSYSHVTGHGAPDYNRVMEQFKSDLSNDYGVDIEKKFELLDKVDKQQEISILFEQYKLVAGSYESVQQRRIGNNNVFVFIYSAIIGLYNFLSNEHVPIADTQLSYSTYIVFLLGMIVGAMWIDMTLSII